MKKRAQKDAQKKRNQLQKVLKKIEIALSKKKLKTKREMIVIEIDIDMTKPHHKNQEKIFLVTKNLK
jgi:hypothetical protein